MDNEQEMLKLVVKIGLVRAQSVEEARLKASRLKERGQPADMIELLQQGGLLTQDQVRRFASGMGKVIPTCFRCLQRSIFDEDSFTGTFICQKCQEPVSFKDRTAGLGDELLPNPPARIVDKLAEKLVAKSGITDAKIEELKRERKTMVPRPTLLEMFHLKGMMKEAQYLQYKGKAEAVYRQRFTQWSKLQQDYELACFLCKMRVVAQKDLSSALQAQMELALNNNYQPLRDALVKGGFLSDNQIREFVHESFDKVARRNELLSSLPGADQLAAANEDIEDSEWEDSLVELGEEKDDNEITLDEAGPDDTLSPKEQQNRKMFNNFYRNELKDIKSTADLKKKPK